MRIDAARYDDLPCGIDDPLRSAGRPESARRPDRDDLLAGNPDIDRGCTLRHDRDPAGNNQIEHHVLPPGVGGSRQRLLTFFRPAVFGKGIEGSSPVTPGIPPRPRH